MNTATPTAAGLRHRAATRRRARFGLFAFTATSVAFNVAVILEQPHTVLRLFLAGLAPVMLAFMGDLLASYQQSDMIPSGTAEKSHKWTRRSVGAIAFGAFALSFQTLHMAAVADHGWFVAFLFPLTLDLAIWVCTWMRVVIARADEHDQAAGVAPHLGWWAARRVRKNPAPVRMAATVVPRSAEQTAEADQVAVRSLEAHELPATPPAVQREAVPRPAAPQPRITVEKQPAEQVPGLAPQLPRDGAPTAVHAVDQPAEQSLTWDDTDTGPIEVQAEQRTDPAAHRDGNRPAPQVDPSPAATAEQPIEDAPRAAPTSPRFEVHRGGLAPTPRPAPRLPRDLDDGSVHREIAERLVEAGRTTATVAQVEQVLRLTAEGVSQRSIADAVGISASAVGRIQERAREMTEPAPVA
ncbi:Uncharacterised protein [Mycobacteroides abscessus subsp. abscessus]|uniref:helix-turn-helix domain-containing protein n=1 Tax=Mycobacteroides abscessus TaxID=36809 RepID=UPI0009A6AB4A|nr:helix-turn-helix domain-containing protein [Mycobacteroides abscessus]SKM35796.1 Uncharacterised protein [Mycobacteroides abscessus subsp. abscessus]